jgi:hypothetical protein
MFAYIFGLDLHRSRRKILGEDLIALLGKREIFFGDSPSSCVVSFNVTLLKRMSISDGD